MSLGDKLLNEVLLMGSCGQRGSEGHLGTDDRGGQELP